jgi:indole-3-acetate monooxygenase
MKTARDRGAVQAAVAEAEAMVRSARVFFHDALAKAWEQAVAGKPFALGDRADLMLASTWAVRSAARATDLMHRMGGTNGVYTRSRLERHFRDAQTVRHHGFVSDSRLETVGQVYLGIPPEFPFVAF